MVIYFVVLLWFLKWCRAQRDSCDLRTLRSALLDSCNSGMAKPYRNRLDVPIDLSSSDTLSDYLHSISIHMPEK